MILGPSSIPLGRPEVREVDVETIEELILDSLTPNERAELRGKKW
jgi:hypothetical protein